MGTKLAAFAVLAGLLWPAAAHAEPVVAFNLSTSRTFSPDEKPTIHLYAHGVNELEFRVYRVRDPQQFLTNLPDMHSFGDRSPWGNKEQIDERTWLEKFHDWKHNLWFTIRQFFRGQFSPASRERLREKQTGLARKSRIVGVAQFAEIPLLNDKQLVARWRQEMPPTFVSDTQALGIDRLPAGMYLVEATDGKYKAYTLLLVSRLALVTRAANGQMIAFAVDRKTGVPAANVEVTLGSEHTQIGKAVTGADGLAEMKTPPRKPDQEGQPQSFWIIAKANASGEPGAYDEIAVITPEGYQFSGYDGEKWSSLVYTDRPVYRPGHTVHWKAVVRAHVENHLELPRLTTMHVKITDEQNHPVFEQDMPVSAAGTLSGEFTLPVTAGLGYYFIRVGDDNTGIGGGFQVQEYRKPEYQVRAMPAQPRVLQGQSMAVTIDSRYFFGEPVANAKVKYKVFRSRHYWWDEDEESAGDSEGAGSADSGDASDQGGGTDLSYGADEETEKTGKLDANGKLTISVPTQNPGKPDPNHMASDSNKRFDEDVTVEAAVTDEANREITGRGHFLATIGSFRIHVEPLSYGVRAGEPAGFHVSAVDYDGKPVATKVHLQMFSRHWDGGRSNIVETGTSADVATDATGNGTVRIPVPNSGSVEIEASATTPEQRVVTDSTWLWVMGGNQEDWGFEGSQQVQLIADKKSYAPGDTAHLSIVSEEAGFHALVTATGYSVEFKQVLSSDGKTLSFDLPITGDSQPNIVVELVFLKDGKLYQARKQINVPPVQQRLQVDIVPVKQIFQPQQTATYDVATKDFAGQPVSADLSFGVVDEAIYSIYPDTMRDVVKQLYPQRYVYADVETSLDYYFSGSAGNKSPMLAERKSRYQPMAQVKPGNDVAQPRVRKAFPDTAFWAPSVHTDAQGHARVTLTFPDSLTTWRTTVRAVTADSRAGAAINRVLVRKNVIVRMGTPRFMNKGDEITLPVIVHNYLDTAKQVTMSLDVTGLGVVAGGTRQITVASKGDGVVPWRLKASQLGTAKLIAKAITDEESDALEIDFPVQPIGVPKTTNAVGVLKGAMPPPHVAGETPATPAPERSLVPVNFAANTDAAARSVRVEVSPSIAGSLFSALDYLTAFPYGCTEQTMSSFLPNVIVAETLTRLHLTAHVDPADLNAKVQAGLERLHGFQHEDGGWGWWKEDDSVLFMSAYVVGGLAEAQRSYKLTYEQQEMQRKGVEYLQKQLADHPRMLPELRAYVVYALAEEGTEGLGGSLDKLWSRRADLSGEGLAFTGLAMLDQKKGDYGAQEHEIATLLEKKAEVGGGLASWKSDYSPLLDDYFDNNAESTAFAMRFLTHVDPANPLVAQAAQWLVLDRHEGYWWSSTEQTAMVLFGLADYLAVSHELNADFDLDVTVNGSSVAHRHFTAADATQGASLRIDLPADKLQAQGNTVEIVKHGAGRAYWSVQGKEYTTDKADFQKGTMSLNLTRDYFKLTPVESNGKVVYRLDPLNGPVQVGDTLAVHLAINGTQAKYLLLEDPIPAGTEFVQHEDAYPLASRPDTWRYWYTRREFHDDRAAIFADAFRGRQESFYLLKVVNPGSFAISPAHVEPMYQPDVQATSDAQHLDVAAPPGQAIQTGG